MRSVDNAQRASQMDDRNPELTELVSGRTPTNKVEEEKKQDDVKNAVVRESQIFNPQSSDRRDTGGFLMKNSLR